MAYDLVFKEEARLDMRDAYQYYEQKQTGLGERFLSALQERFTVIKSHPEYYSYIDRKKILRDVAVSNFPYVIIYYCRSASENLRYTFNP
jgi:hypothetical protein